MSLTIEPTRFTSFGRMPDSIIACVGGGSNAMGMFYPFLDNDVRLVGVEAAGHGLDTNDHATIFYTSGSTGFPKGVLSTHRNILATLFSWALVTTLKRELEAFENIEDISEKAETNEIEGINVPVQSSILHCVPLFHVTGSHAGFLMSIIAGRKMVMMNKWDPGKALQLIQPLLHS